MATKKTATPAQPKMIDQIVQAIAKMAETRGSSVAAIKKTLEGMGVDTAKKNAVINNALNRGVTTGALKQVKGNGATGTFKIDTARAAAAEKEKIRKQKAKERMAKKAESDRKKKLEAREKAKAKKAKAAKKKPATKAKPGKKVAKTPTKKAAAKKSTKAVKPKKVVKPKKPATKKPVVAKKVTKK